jgi:hypothetical protein
MPKGGMGDGHGVLALQAAFDFFVFCVFFFLNLHILSYHSLALYTYYLQWLFLCLLGCFCFCFFTAEFAVFGESTRSPTVVRCTIWYRGVIDFFFWECAGVSKVRQ